MVKKLVAVTLLMSFYLSSYSQRVVFDQKHFQIVNENAAVRNAAESTHNQFLEKIDRNLNNININTGSIILAQKIIYNSLVNVNSALKNGLAVKNMTYIVADILKCSNQMINMVKDEPYLLLFAEGMSTELKDRSTKLLLNISGVILNENVLADYRTRDNLIRNTTQELQIINGLVYGAWKAMYWTKQKGLLRSINPYSDFINADRQIIGDIIRNSKYLNK